jgi:hypothetical protein
VESFRQKLPIFDLSLQLSKASGAANPVACAERKSLTKLVAIFWRKS